MAFSADSFKKAMGSPIKPAGGSMGAPAGGEMDMESLMKAPGSMPPGGPGEIGEPGDSAAEEGSESSLESALESAGIQATPEQLSEIKNILGISGGMSPMAGSESEDVGAAPSSKPAFSSKLDKMFGK